MTNSSTGADNVAFWPWKAHQCWSFNKGAAILLLAPRIEVHRSVRKLRGRNVDCVFLQETDQAAWNVTHRVPMMAMKTGQVDQHDWGNRDRQLAILKGNY